MITYILPGFSLKNKEWLEECAMSLKVEGTIRPIFWEHWDDSEAKFDKKEKATLLSRHSKGDKINIIAKSIGSLVASYIIEQVPHQINKVIICGIPINDIGESEKETIKKALESLGVEKLICFQNGGDPHGNFDQIRAFLPEKIKVVSKERSDHHYPYYTEFNGFLKS
jgi:predicted alpha/beta-hydrolase family hydrolase